MSKLILYTIYRRLRNAWLALFPSVVDHADIEIKKIQCSKHVKNVVLSENKFLVLMTNDAEVILRRPPSSDISVFNQIFNIEEYKPLVGLAKNLFKTKSLASVVEVLPAGVS